MTKIMSWIKESMKSKVVDRLEMKEEELDYGETIDVAETIEDLRIYPQSIRVLDSSIWRRKEAKSSRRRVWNIPRRQRHWRIGRRAKVRFVVFVVIVGGRRFVQNHIKRRGKFQIRPRLCKIKRSSVHSLIYITFQRCCCTDQQFLSSSCRKIVSILNACQVFDQMFLRNLVLKFHFILLSLNSACVLRLCWDLGGRESEKLIALGTQSGTISVVVREVSWFGNSRLVSLSYTQKRFVRLATFHLVHDFFDRLHDKCHEAEGLTSLAKDDALCKVCIPINAARLFEFVWKERDENVFFSKMTTDPEHLVAICIGKLLLVKDAAQPCYSLVEVSHLLYLSCHQCKRDDNMVKISCKECIKLLEFFYMEDFSKAERDAFFIEIKKSIACTYGVEEQFMGIYFFESMVSKFALSTSTAMGLSVEIHEQCQCSLEVKYLQAFYSWAKNCLINFYSKLVDGSATISDLKVCSAALCLKFQILNWNF